MVKHVEGRKLKKSFDKDHNVYLRSFSGAKVKCMKDYVKPCIREKNPDYVILHVGANELNSELRPEKKAKTLKLLKTLNQTVELLVYLALYLAMITLTSKRWK